MGNNRFFVGLLSTALCASLLLSGCDDGKAPGETTGKEIKSPIEINYLYDNQIVISDIDADENGDPVVTEEEQPDPAARGRFEGRLMQIDGLKDQAVEKKINGRLKELYLSCVGALPPYRGIKAVLGEEYGVSYQGIQMDVAANFNNILSVSIRSGSDYYKMEAPKESQYINWCQTLNFDLNTGEEIPIADLFCDDVDGMKYLDDYMADLIMGSNADEEGWFSGESDLKITGPFTGLSQEQKYILREGDLWLIFDYETPEFYTGFYPREVNVPFSSEMALSERFFDPEKNIYEAQEPWAKRLLQKPQEGGEDYTYSEDGEIRIYVSGSWPDGLPKKTQTLLEGLCQIDSGAIAKEMEPYVDMALDEYSRESIEASYSKWVSANEVGKFINVTSDESMWVVGSQWETDQRSIYLQKSQPSANIYRLKEEAPLKMEDLFADGLDFETAVKNAMTASGKSQLAENAAESGRQPYQFGEGETKEQDLAYIDKLYDKISGLSIGTDRLSLNFDGAEDIFQEVYGKHWQEYEDGYRFISFGESVTYKDLGCDNLTIFD